MTRSHSIFTRRGGAVAVALLALFVGASCGKSMMSQGDGSSYLIVTLLGAAPGGDGGTVSTQLQSSVSSGTDDMGQVTLRMALKDTISGLTPTDSNTITITGYHVEYVPATAGTAVPASFDGALTGTVTASDTTLPFILVRALAKGAAPLAGLAAPLETVARVTFIGHDQAGHGVQVTASISVTFVS